MFPLPKMDKGKKQTSHKSKKNIHKFKFFLQFYLKKNNL